MELHASPEEDPGSGAAAPRRRSPAGGAAGEPGGPVPLAEVASESTSPVPTGLAEVDRVLGGGLVPGSVTLIGGEPGIGKSTLLLQVLAKRAEAGAPVLLASAEESAAQVAMRARRLGRIPEHLHVLATDDVGEVEAAVDAGGPGLVVVDSIQLLTERSGADALDAHGGAAGELARLRRCAERLVALAKSTGTAVILVGHLTKDGALAGPRYLEHLVDTVLTLGGEQGRDLRVLRATKHRFGPTGEIGVFEMRARGLAAVERPGELLLAERVPGVPGAALTPLLEGRRALVVEVQALLAPGVGAHARRAASGVDPKRLDVVLAVLANRLRMPLHHFDVHVSAAGGLRVREPAADLAMLMAVVSTACGVPLPASSAVCGEVGLVGEVRGVEGIGHRLQAADAIGIDQVLVPASTPVYRGRLSLVRVTTVAEAVAWLVGEPAAGAVLTRAIAS